MDGCVRHVEEHVQHVQPPAYTHSHVQTVRHSLSLTVCVITHCN
jgi:hypothetical protein